MERRISHWCNFEAILEEDRTIQSRLTRCENKRGDYNDASRLAELMMKGRLREARKSMHLKKKHTNDSKAEGIMKALPETAQRAVALVQEQGAGARLNTLPIEGFALCKGAFRDVLVL